MEHWSEFQENIYFCFIVHTKSSDHVDHNKLGKILKEMGASDHLTCFLRNLYAGQKAELEPDIETGPASNWERKTGYISSPCLFNLYAEYIWWNAMLDVAQAGIKIAGRTINNIRYTDDTTTMEERKEKLKSLLMWVKGE